MNSIRQSYTRVLTVLTFAALVLTLTLAPIPAHAQTPTIVYSFTGSSQPQNPYSWAIAQGRDGNLYGSTTSTVSTGTSAVFNVTPSGTLTVVASIQDSYGATLGTDGNFYSAAQLGGTSSIGEVFKVTPAGVVTVLHNFTGGSDGSRPVSPPIQGTNGSFYGTTTSQGVPNSTAYSVTSSGVFTTLHTFTGTDGQNIFAPLVQGTDGNFYGVTVSGGTSNDGVIFKMTPTGTVTVLHNFAGTDGSTGYWGLIQGTDGNFYGTTYAGGPAGSGVIFKITSSGTYTVLYDFTGPANQNVPYSSLIQATNGKLYGVTSFVSGPFYFGTIYSITTSGTFTSLYSFANAATVGDQPSSPLRQHTNGLLYGATFSGGDSGCGSLEYDGEWVEVSGCGTVYSLNIGAAAFASLVSTSGKVGTKIGILGQSFSSASVVKFAGVQATAITLSGTTFITATVPAGALTGKVTVTTGTTTLTSPQSFKVKPTITTFAPPSGPVGTPVTITGTGLTQATKVTFNGTSASFTVNSDTQITATVPTGATTGKIAVTSKGGSATSTTSFTVN